MGILCSHYLCNNYPFVYSRLPDLIDVSRTHNVSWGTNNILMRTYVRLVYKYESACNPCPDAVAAAALTVREVDRPLGYARSLAMRMRLHCTPGASNLLVSSRLLPMIVGSQSTPYSATYPKSQQKSYETKPAISLASPGVYASPYRRSLTQSAPPSSSCPLSRPPPRPAAQ